MQPNNPYYPPAGPPANPQPGGVMPPPMNPQMPGPSHSQQKSGRSIGWIVTVVILSLLLVGALGFGYWAFTERQDYKNNSDQKVAAAVTEAKKQQQQEDNLAFAEELKNPLKPYTGPASFGSVKVMYPKTWSAYANLINDSNTPVDVYFHPDVVPAVVGASPTERQAVALRLEVRSQAYDELLLNMDSLVKAGQVKATPYALPKMPDQVGTKIVGKLESQIQGTQIILPLRDKTIIITTETDKFMKDFNKYIIPNLSFEP